MSTAILEPPARLFGESSRANVRSGGRLTLEERLRATWQAAGSEGAADCPLCGSRMTYRGEAAECGSCGSRLS